MKDCNNDFVYDEEEVKKGHVNPEFVKRHNLSENCHPADWFKAFLSNRAGKITKHGTDVWNAFTNLKGLLSNLGHQSRTYSKFKRFSPIEIMVFVGLVTLNRLTPSMSFEHKFKSQMEDLVAGKDLCARIFGENGARH